MVNGLLKRWAIGAILVSNVLLIVPVAPGQDRLRDGDTVAIIGDSITQARKYSVLIETYLLVCRPAASNQAMLFGWSGEEAWELNQRVNNDIVRYAPSVVTTSYGMNDGHYTAFQDRHGDVFRNETRNYVRQLKQGGTRLIVIGSPGCVDTFSFKRTAPAIYNDTLKRFGEIAREVADEESVVFADVHTPMIDAMKQAKTHFGDDYLFVGRDGMHPEWSGHMIMAYAYLKALIGEFEIGVIRVDFASNSAVASEGHIILSSQNGVIELESSRYPFCFFGDKRDPDGTRSSATLTDFNDKLNRFMLMVDNAPARCKVTWGSQSKIFTDKELAKGINLAAEFLEKNPFYGPFMNVLQGVRDKQTFEIHMIKRFVTNVPVIERILPQETDTVTRLVDAFTTERQAKADGLVRLVAPVRHRLVIEPMLGTGAESTDP